MPSIQELQEQLAETHEAAVNLQNAADEAGRPLTDEEADQLDGWLNHCEYLQGEISNRNRLAAVAERLKERPGRKVDPQTQPPRRSSSDRITPLGPNAEKDPNHGFQNAADFFRAVQNAAPGGGGVVDQRLLLNAPTTYGSEGVGADGGFALPPNFRSGVMEQITGEESLLSRTDQQTISQGNTYTASIDPESPWSTGGVRVYWTAENAQQTQSKPALKQVDLKLHKLVSLVPLTNELLEDASSVESWLRSKVPKIITTELNNVIVAGTGAGQPKGITASDATVSVAKVASQDATTFVAENVVKMYSRMWADCIPRSVWLINQDVLPEILTMSYPGKDVTGTAVTGYGSLVFTPPGGLSDTPYGTLMGRPIIPVQGCATLGTVGDVIFADLSQYLTVTKTGGSRAEMSMHVWFDYDTSAFKFTMRIAGQSWWPAAVSAKNGSNTYSPFVTVATRA